MSDDSRYLHLTPADVWSSQEDGETYEPEAFRADGFIHLTIGEANLIEIANLFYRDDPRTYVVLTIHPGSITAPVRFDDDSGRYPHVYGTLNTDAVMAVTTVRRDDDGSFRGFA
jgi:uncharacterized protein (DUF952 family)